MCDWKAHEIVEILVKDAALLKSRRRFAHTLKIPENCLTDFEHIYQLHSDSYAFFCDVLEKWKSMNGNEATISLLSNILRENDFKASADLLSTLNNCIHSHVTKFGVKEPVFNFVGRKKELFLLNDLFMEKKSCVLLCSAMGGKGKTELCRRFIQQLPNAIDTLVTWLSGDGLQQFQQSLSEVGQSMNVHTTDSAGKPISVDKIIENISSKKKSKWLVIIDNLEEEFPDFFTAIDTLQRNGAFVLVTSRKTDIQTEQHIYLTDLKDEDAWEFVSISLNKNPCQKLVEELCKYLQNYPLALQQAIAFIKYKQRVEEDSYGIEDYLQELNSDNSNAFDHKIPSTGYGDTVLKVFELTLHKILSIPANNAFILLQIQSLLHPDRTEKEFLKELFSFFEPGELFASNLSILKSFSFIGVNKGEVSIHRIVQKLTRDRMKAENKFCLVIDKIFEKIDTRKLKKRPIAQVVQIWKNALSESTIIQNNSNFGLKICDRLLHLSLYRKMKYFSEIALQQFIKFLRPDAADTWRMQNELGKALERNGEYKEALEKFQFLWEKRKEVLGEEHEEILSCAGEIASVLHRLKRLDESMQWFERVLKSQIKVLGENHGRTIRTKNNMAVVLNKQGKSEEALSIFKQILEWREKEVGHDRPSTLTTRHNIAICFLEQKKYEEAKKEFEEVLELRLKVLGEEHADPITTNYWLSATLYFLGKKEEAIEMMQQVLILREKVLGPNHPHTKITRNRISKWILE